MIRNQLAHGRWDVDVRTDEVVNYRGIASSPEQDDPRAFPLDARREAGHQLDQVQRGQEPDDF